MKFKRILAIILTVMTLLQSFAFTATAAEIVDSGKCGDNLTYTLYDDGKLVIEGTGEMPYFSSYSSTPWHSRRSLVKTVEISDGITSIGNEAFSYFDKLESIVIPNSVTSIGNGAFSHCHLKSIVIPDSVTSIGYNAFYDCDSLKSIVIPDGVTSIGHDAFRNCISLESVVIPNSVTRIDYNAFEGCTSLESVTIGDSVTIILRGAFSCCESLESIVIPNSVTSIDYNAFERCTSLKSVTIYNENLVFYNYVFSNCPSTLTLYGYNGSTTEEYADDNGIKFVALDGDEEDEEDEKDEEDEEENKCGENLYWSLSKGTLTISGKGKMYDFDGTNTPWYNERQDIEKVVIESGATSIGNNAFFECSSLESIEIPDTLIDINNEAFCKCTSLENVVIPDNVTSIGNYAFYNCKNLESITIYNKNLDFVTYVFYGCPSTLTLYGYSGSTTETYAKRNGIKFVALDGDEEDEKDEEDEEENKCGENLYWSLSNGVLTISGSGKMYDFDSQNAPWYSERKNIKKIIVESSVTSIGNNAFKDCAELESTTVYNKNLDFGYDVFDGCPSTLTLYGYKGSTTEEYADDFVLRFVALDADIIISCAHNYEESDYVAPTCTKNGKQYYICTLCDEEYVETIPAKHSYSSKWTTDKEPTCSQDGSKSRHCTKCNAKTDVTTIPATGEHDYSAWKQNKAPTCTADGQNKRTCTACSHAEYQVVAALGHDFSSTWTVDIEPTCTKEGSSSRHCSRCSEKTDVKTLAAKGHSFGEWVTNIAPTCIKDGQNKRTCTACSHAEYQVVAALGHDFSLSWETDVEPTCTAKGSTSRHCSRCSEKTDIISIEAKGHSFGEWITDIVPTFLSDGSKHRSCTACGFKETAPISKIEYDLNNNPNHGAVNFRVVDATTLVPVSGMNITCGNVTVTTDAEGKAYAVLPVGRQQVSVYGGSYITRNLNVTVNNGLNNIPDIGVSTKPLIDVIFDHKEMTIEEIIDAGIDITAEENQHVYNYEFKLTFVPEVDYYNINFYWNGNGDLVKIDPVPIPEPEPKPDPGDYYYPYHYGPPIIIYPDDDDDDDDDDPPYIIIPDPVNPVTIYPVSEKFYLVVYGKVKWLKEMYDVQMIVINNSLTDTVEDCTATLSLPDGLSLATMLPGFEQSLVQKIEYIPQGGKADVHWYIRGDKKGSYFIDATLEGKLMPFEESFKYDYTTQDPIIVEAGSAMHMTFEVPGVAYYGEDYPIRITLENVSDMPVYGISHTITSVDQYKITSYSDGTQKKEEYGTSGGGSISHDIFNPGEKIVIELNANIMFESDMIKQRLSSIVDYLEGIDTMLCAFEAYQAAAESISMLTNILSYANQNIAEIVVASVVTQQVQTALNSVLSECAVINGKSVYIASAIESSEYYYIMKQWADNSELSEIPENELISCAAFINKVLADANAKPSQEFRVFDMITSMIMATPIKFVLSDAVVTTLEGSTTEIPYTIKVVENPNTPVSFGTTNVGMLAYSAVVALLGEVDIPPILKLLNIPDSTYGYKEAIEYLRAAKEDLERFAAQSATGKTSFKAWIEDADGNIIPPDTSLQNIALPVARSASSSPFTLDCSNPTAKISDGILTFEGAGYIDVTPHTSEGATLCIEMTENGVTKTEKYQLEVVEDHECTSSKWETLVPAYDGAGYRAKLCGVCDDIIEIESYSANVFSDVPTDTWYHSAVQYAVTNSIMNGTSETTFSPENGLTRAMFITVLHRLAGSPEGEQHSFTDVEQNSWYEKAVEWASSNGIINGVAPGEFAPNSEITREQMATVVYRYAKYKNYDMKGAQSVEYSDVADIALYANEAVLWCSEKGIMKGNADGTFMPANRSTRAQAATVFMRLLTVFDR